MSYYLFLTISRFWPIFFPKNKALCHDAVYCWQLKIIEILLKGCNNAEDYVQKVKLTIEVNVLLLLMIYSHFLNHATSPNQCKRLIIQNAPIIMENIKKFLEKRDFCNSIHVCGSKSVRAGSQVLRSLSSAWSPELARIVMIMQQILV